MAISSPLRSESDKKKEKLLIQEREGERKKKPPTPRINNGTPTNLSPIPKA